MGARKPTTSTGRQPRGIVKKMTSRNTSTQKTSLASEKQKSTSSKTEKSSKKIDSKESAGLKQVNNPKQSSSINLPKQTAVKRDLVLPPSTVVSPKQNFPSTTTSPAAGAGKSSSGRNTPKRIPESLLPQPKHEDKAKALNKMLKSLDIKISGFKNVIEEPKPAECKASISEIVKTKSRAAAVRVGSSLSPKVKKKFLNGDKKSQNVPGKMIDDKIDDGEILEKTKEVKGKKCVDEGRKIEKPKGKEKIATSGPKNQNIKKIEENVSSSTQVKGTIKSMEKDKCSAKKELEGDNLMANKKEDLAKKSTEVVANVKETDLVNVDQSKGKANKKGATNANKKKQEEDTKKKEPTKQTTKSKKGLADKKEEKCDESSKKAKVAKVIKKTEPKAKGGKNSSKKVDNIEGEEQPGVTGLNETVQPPTGKKTTAKKPSNKPKNAQKNVIKGDLSENKDQNVLDEKNKCQKPDCGPKEKDQIPLTDSGKNKVKSKSKDECNFEPNSTNVASLIERNELRKSIDEKLHTACEKVVKVKDSTNEKESAAHKKVSVEKVLMSQKVIGVEKLVASEQVTKTPKDNVSNDRANEQKLPEKFSTDEKLSGENFKAGKTVLTDVKDLKETVYDVEEFNQMLTTLPKEVSPDLPLLSQSAKILSVRERLQKKYVQNRTTGFNSFKLNKQTKPIKKSVKMKPDKSIAKFCIAKEGNVDDDKIEKKEKDIYDFKTESESDDNIKMNLLGESSILSKIRLENEFSDDDDKPLQLTKMKLKEEKALKRVEDNKNTKLKDVKEEKKPETPVKKSAGQNKKTVSTAVAKKSKVVKKPTVTKRKEQMAADGSSSDSDADSDDSSSSSSVISVGPKRHRMASLNALAKVQCLYENESRTAHELGLSKTAQIPRIRLINSGSSSEEDKDVDKKPLTVKEIKKEIPSENENKRELRNAPGLRGIGKHWEFNDVSSFESGHESDVTFRSRGDHKAKKKKKVVKPKAQPAKDKEKPEPKPKKAVKVPKRKARTPPPQRRSSSESSDDDEDLKEIQSRVQNKKRKREKVEDIPNDLRGILARKRIASLNATALVAATYEVERHLDRNLNSDCSSFESFPEDEKPFVVTASKKLKDIKKDKSEESNKDGKECSRPTSSSVVIVQDTDVTITGVYVNASTGSSQEAYCKMQYRVQSSVTEERVLRPGSIDPPKSYTPLGALSSMRPPGAGIAGDGVQQHTSPSLQHQQPSGGPPPSANIYQSPTISQELTPANAHIYPPPHHHPSPPIALAHQHPIEPPPLSLHHHHLHHPQHPAKYPPHISRHHHQPHQPTPLAQSRCESPVRYPSVAYQSVQPPHPPSSLTMPGSGSSAFCAPMQQSHHDMSGYYQPAGPLISPHVLPTVPQANAALVSTKQVPSPLDSDPDQLQQPPPSTSAAESSDSEVLITGGDLTTFRYTTQQQQQTASQQQQQQQLSVLSSQQQSQQGSPYSRSMHQMHYPPAYPPSYYSPYPGDAMCYSPPYQPYFPAKVYQSAPAYRRYPSYYQPGHPPPSELYEPPPPSSAAPPPPTGTQLVPAGPTAPQHMEHYPGPPGFYSGYSPGGGQCYTRGIQPPYMEYPPPCPCPMQSYPKNVLTGPLIGSNTNGNNNSNNNSVSNPMNTSNNINNNTTNSINGNNSTNNNNHNNISQPLKANKGPVQQVQHSIKTHNHIVGGMEPTNQLSSGSIIGKGHLHRHHVHQCKMEIIEPLKSDLKTEIADPMISSDNIKGSQYEEMPVPPTPPTVYTINDKLIEPEISVSPARGSTGLPTIPDQTDKAASTPAGAVNSLQQPVPAMIHRETGDTIVNSNLPPIIGRKARLGKTMAREMMYGAHALAHHHQQHPQIYSHTHLHHHLPSHNTSTDMIGMTSSLTDLTTPIQHEFNKIKKEEIKKEEDDVVVILDDEKKIKTEPEIVEVFDDKVDSASKDSIIETEIVDADDEDRISHQGNLKRMKILELNKPQCKKSPPNGYKSLIKQAEPKPYLCLSRKSDKKERYMKLSSKNGIRKRKLLLTEQQKKRLIMRKRKLLLERQKLKLEKANKDKMASFSRDQQTNSRKESKFVEESSNSCRMDEMMLPRKSTGHGQESVSRGYFSEPEIPSSIGRKMKKTKSSEARSKSETKKSRQSSTFVKAHCFSTSVSVQNSTSFKQQDPDQLRHPTDDQAKNASPQDDDVSSDTEKCEKCNAKHDNKKRKRDELCSPKAKCAKRSKSSQSESLESEASSEDLSQTMLSGSASVNNNNVLETNNNKFLEMTDEGEKSDMATYPSLDGIIQPVMHHRQPAKRTRSRSKFGNKKRQRAKQFTEIVDPIVIPRKLNVIPRWNNGWSWEGEPFQGKVFLNSDDPLVLRTCYPAMRHVEGDVVHPRDCVLLRAGTKKNELPYVAKVAHLWENPEDGEMMMSLLWYYRPEHTEQGRQSNDNADEVFASRHRDHNSVACIEDKCYVLTFSEYCRYRKTVRAAEEEIPEEPLIVPNLPNHIPLRQVPVSTNPEQVLFCQRIYDFRLKRLMKTSTNN